MNAAEIPVAFECEGDTLIGVVHAPAGPTRSGVLMIVAGGPQYRAGCSRQLLLIARAMANRGIAVMRFDYRGLGDSGGEFRGFQTIHPDLVAALETFKHHVPGLAEVVLWGGCDAASAAMIHGWRLPQVKGMILANPFTSSEATRARMIVRTYYWDRLRDKAFWEKVLKLRFNPVAAGTDLARTVMRSFGQARFKASVAGGDPLGNGPFPERMREGFRRFKGPALLLMSGKSLVRQEFDYVVASSPEWTEVMSDSRITRCTIEHADQALSTVAARHDAIEAALDWLQSAGFLARNPAERAA